MGEPLEQAVYEVLTRHGETGMAMGALVDEVLADGGRDEAVEMAIWHLLEQGRVVPSGFVCRIVRKRDAAGKPFNLRTYELMLTCTPADRSQLPLDLEEER
jgi:hypothetical protein